MLPYRKFHSVALQKVLTIATSLF